MSKKAYLTFEKPFAVARNKMFLLTGVVKSSIRFRRHTRLTIESITLDRTKELKERFYVYFQDDIKDFVDNNIELNYIVEVTGNMVVSSKSTEEQQIIVLDGKHVTGFKNYVYAHEEVASKVVDVSELKDKKDLAF